MNNSFDPKNPRVKLAHQKNVLNTTIIRFLIVIIFLLLLLGGITMLVMKKPIGWTFVGFSAVPAILLFWIKNALANIDIGKTTDFTDLISDQLLVAIKENMSPADLITVIPKTKSGLFVISRFSLPGQFFGQIAPYLPPATEIIYEIARNIREETQSEEITGAIIAVAIIKSVPDHERWLSQLRLSIDDLYQGIIWYNYLNGLVKDAKRPIHTGGIARDLSFGYTPTLQKFAINLSSQYGVGNSNRIQQAENAEILQKMIDIFTHPGRQNVALVGAYGSGRSSIVESFSRTLLDANSGLPNSLKFRQIYSLDPTSIISVAKNTGDIEYLMIRIFNEIYSAKNIILCLDNAHLFFEEGPGSIDITNFLIPILEAGQIRIIMIMDDQKFLEISAKNSALTNLLNKIVVNPTGYEETIKILMDQAPFLEYQKNVVITYKSLTEAYRLSEQYIHDIEMPGKAKLLLESATSYAENGVVTDLSVQTAVEKSYGVRIKVANDNNDREKLLNLENLIHERMIDQTEAVSAVSNALRRAGAGVKNSGRPIGTFLFLGPTGVGKTELAKTLSEVYFDGESNIVRLDLNEFVSANDVSRLIKDGAEDEMSLTAQIMKQPFSVVLLDEIEKAHPAVLTTLLQLLDEGILRDEKNREVSFRDCIVIATSNAGANEIRERITAGERIENLKEDIINKMIADGEFKPEFLNRFDEVCIFKPLSKEDLLKVLDLMIASTNKTLASQKIAVELDDTAKQILIEKGYDPKMGARPMRRMVQSNVENIVAAAILSGHATPGSILRITGTEIQIS